MPTAPAMIAVFRHGSRIGGRFASLSGMTAFLMPSTPR